MVYTVTLNPSLDYVTHLDCLIPGQINRTREERLFPGGKGINLSLVLSALGVENVALGFIGGETGQFIEDTLSAQNIKTNFIKLPSGSSRINIKILAKEETEINGAGPSVDKAALFALYQHINQLADGDVLILSGSVPCGLRDNTYTDILAQIKGHDVSFVIDSHGPLLTQTLQYRPFLIKPNLVELGDLFGKKLFHEEDIATHAHLLKEQGARNVLVSMGHRGALLLDENGNLHRHFAAPGAVVSSVGAGDAMLAGFLAGWINHRDYMPALRLGIAAGSATAFRYGLASHEEIFHVLASLSSPNENMHA